MVDIVLRKNIFWGKYLNLTIMVGAAYIHFVSTDLFAEDTSYSVNNFGGIGLLDMRNARFFPDGTIAIGSHYNDQVIRYFSTWQATPWLETSLSYSDDKSPTLGIDRSLDVKIRLLREGNFQPQVAIGIQDALGSGRYSGEYIVASKKYYDFDFTMGLAWGYLGSRGGLGNMFRLFGNSFDKRSDTISSGGIATGNYFAGHDMSFFAGAEYHPPIKGLSFKIEYSGVDTTKYVDFSHLKRKTAFNLGINYQPTNWMDLAVGYDYGNRFTIRVTLRQNLKKMKLNRLFRDREPAPILERSRPQVSENLLPIVSSEISKNEKVFDRLRRLGAMVTGIDQEQDKIILHVQTEGRDDSDHMMLLGAVLEIYDRISLYIDNGSEIQRYDAGRSDTIGKAAVEKFKKSPIFAREISLKDDMQILGTEIASSTFDKLKKAGLSPVAISLDAQEVKVRKENGPNFKEAKNIGRTARILTREMPDSIEKFTIVSEDNNLEISRVSFLRRDLENANHYQGSPEEIWANTVVLTPGNEKQDMLDKASSSITYQPDQYPRLEWGILPEQLTHFGGNRDGRFRADLYAKLFGIAQVTKNVTLSASLKQYILGDIDKIPQDLRPAIPKVRSDIGRYSKEGRTALERFQIDYTAQIDQDIYTRLSAGLLESMYGGLSAEFIYRPYQNKFAFGVDLNWVKQRDYDQLFSFRNYNVWTGHAALYYENTTYNISSKLSVGRYLAGDYGATLDVSRRFSNGIRIGVWATYTDMSTKEFGEGSFDKGVYLTMPLEIFWYKPTRESIRYNFRSLGKNGGQMLDRGRSLYETLSIGRKERLADDWSEVLE